MGYKMSGPSLYKKLFKKPVGPVAEVKKTDFEKMSHAEQEEYMNTKHHSIVPKLSDFIYSAKHKNKNKKKKDK